MSNAVSALDPRNAIARLRSEGNTKLKELREFVGLTLQSYPTLWSEYDPNWRSPCEIGDPVEHNGSTAVPWRPLERHDVDDFSGLERAFKTEIHESIKSYYGSYWSGCLEAEASEGHVSLILLWNPDDRDRLMENLIGHAMAQQRSRSTLSIFFACTVPESELFLAVNNSTGEVQLERPGYKPIRTVAPSLGAFLSELSPAPPYMHPERKNLEGLFRQRSPVSQ